MVVGWEVIYKRIAGSEFGFVIEIVSATYSEYELPGVLYPIVFRPEVYIAPHAPMIAETGLIEIAQPRLLIVVDALGVLRSGVLNAQCRYQT